MDTKPKPNANRAAALALDSTICPRCQGDKFPGERTCDRCRVAQRNRQPGLPTLPSAPAGSGNPFVDAVRDHFSTVDCRDRLLVFHAPDSMDVTALQRTQADLVTWLPQEQYGYIGLVFLGNGLRVEALHEDQLAEIGLRRL